MTMIAPPEVASLCARADFHRVQRNHRESLEAIKNAPPITDCRKPVSLHSRLGKAQKKAREFQLKEQASEINKHNRVLVEKIYWIAQKSQDKQQSVKEESREILRPEPKAVSHAKSLHEPFRRRQANEINSQNLAMVKRIVAVKSVFNVCGLENDFKNHRRYSKNCSRNMARMAADQALLSDGRLPALPESRAGSGPPSARRSARGMKDQKTPRSGRPTPRKKLHATTASHPESPPSGMQRDDDKESSWKREAELETTVKRRWEATSAKRETAESLAPTETAVPVTGAMTDLATYDIDFLDEESDECDQSAPSEQEVVVSHVQEAAAVPEGSDSEDGAPEAAAAASGGSTPPTAVAAARAESPPAAASPSPSPSPEPAPAPAAAGEEDSDYEDDYDADETMGSAQSEEDAVASATLSNAEGTKLGEDVDSDEEPPTYATAPAPGATEGSSGGGSVDSEDENESDYGSESV